MASLFNQQISQTYQGLLKTTGNGVLTSSLAQITDGSGNGSKLYLSTSKINFYNEYEFPTTDGSANQVLKTDGNGVLTWENDSVASTLNFSGSTSGTGSVALNTQTLAFTGTANQITATASSQAITFAFPSGGVTLPNGSVATTQSASDNSTKVATTAYVEAAVAAGGTGNVNVSGTPSANQIAIWTNATTIKGMSTLTIDTNGKITLTQSATNYNIGGGNLASVSGTFNTGFGEDNLNDITSGLRNTAFGYQTLKDLTIGTDNVAVGYTALTDATEAVECIAVGSNALSNVTTGHFNIGIGHTAGSQITTSTRNTLVGRSAGSALDTVSSGGYNTFIGYHSGLSVTSGAKNVILGSNTGSTIATSSNNIIISDGDGNNRLQFASTGAATFATNSNSSIVNHFTNSDTTDASTRNTIELTAGNRFLQLQAYNADHVYLNRSSGSDLYFQLNGATQQIFKSGGQVEFKGYLSVEPAVSAGTSSFMQWKNDTSLFAYTGSAAAILSGGAAADYVAGNTTTAANVILSTNNTERLRVDSSGKVGIGITPTETLTLGGTANVQLTLKSNDTSNGYSEIYFGDSDATNRGYISYSHSSDAMSFGTAASTKLTISSSGNLGINATPVSSRKVLIKGDGNSGTTNASFLVVDSSNADKFIIYDNGLTVVNNVFQVLGNGSSYATHEFTTQNANVAKYIMRDASGVTINQFSADSAAMNFLGASAFGVFTQSPNDVNGTNISSDGNIQVYSNNNNANLIANGGTAGTLLLNDRGASANSRLWRVKSDGGVFSINALTDAISAKHNSLEISEGGNVSINQTPQSNIQLFVHGYDTSTTYAILSDDSAGNGTFNVQNNGNGFLKASAWTYGSDIKLKENISNVENGIDMVSKMKPKHFDYINGTKNNIGFIAQDVQEIIPQAVRYVDEKETILGLKTDFLIPYLVKAIQEQQTIIDDLKSRIEKLEL